jgi:hypothetical protein
MKFLTQNVLISLVSSLVLVILIYIINNRNDEKVSKMTLLKYYMANVVGIYGILFIKNSLDNKSPVSLIGGGGGEGYQSNISVGEPNF